MNYNITLHKKIEKIKKKFFKDMTSDEISNNFNKFNSTTSGNSTTKQDKIERDIYINFSKYFIKRKNHNTRELDNIYKTLKKLIQLYNKYK